MIHEEALLQRYVRSFTYLFFQLLRLGCGWV